MMSRSVFVAVGIGAALVAAACSVKDPLYCQSNADCEDPARPVCDVKGAFASSDHIANTCIPTPDNCPAEVCGCTAGEFLACTADNAEHCGADGMSVDTMACADGCSTEAGGCKCAAGTSSCSNGSVARCGPTGVFGAPVTCPLGCADTIRCTDISASNGLNAALDSAEPRQDLTLADGAIIDTSTGLVLDGNAASIVVPSVVVPQSGGPSIRAFLVNAASLGSVRVKGANAFAIVADGAIEIHGVLDASATGTTSGPGSVSSGPCVGTASMTSYDQTFGEWGNGAGGAGHATVGGRGGFGGTATVGTAGGAVSGSTSASPLVGGCKGGDLVFHTGAVGNSGGPGGGAVQLVSRLSIALTRSGTSAGVIDVGGAGGANVGAGGGAGGAVLLEAPAVTIDGAGAGVFANGGAGGACSMPGADATPTMQPAPGKTCACNGGGGDGGTGTIAATNAPTIAPPTPPQQCLVYYNQGGGGGAAGRVRINTQSGTFAATNGGAISASSSIGTIGTR